MIFDIAPGLGPEKQVFNFIWSISLLHYDHSVKHIVCKRPRDLPKNIFNDGAKAMLQTCEGLKTVESC